MATGHTTTWIEWNMPMPKVRQAATIYQHLQGVAMRVPGRGGVDPDEYRLVMGE